MVRKVIVILILLATASGTVAYFSFSHPLSYNIKNVFTTSSCPIVTRTYPNNSSYKGPLIDTHIHIPSIPDGPNIEIIKDPNRNPVMGVDIAIPDYICMMNTEGTESVFAFFPVWDPIRKESLGIVKETMQRYPGRFIPFIMPPDHDDRTDGFPTITASVLEEMLSLYPGLFKGYGEIGLYTRGDHGGPKGAPELPPDNLRLQEIYPVVRRNNLLVYFHLGEGQKASFEKALEQNPDINFIWHGDQLITSDRDKQNLSSIEDILYQHPNAHYGVDELYGDIWLLKPGSDKKDFLAHFENYKPLLEKDLETWKGFIERHPNQVLWGTDRGWAPLWSIDADVAITLNNYSRAFIGRLNPAVQENFAYKNAERLSRNLAN